MVSVIRHSSGVLGAPGALIGRSQGAHRALSSVIMFDYDRPSSG